MLSTVTLVTSKLSVAFTVTRICSPVLGVVVFNIIVLITGGVVSTANQTVLEFIFPDVLFA